MYIDRQEESSQQEDILTEETTFESITLDGDSTDSTVPTPTEAYEAMIALKDQDAYKEGTIWTDYEPYSDSAGYYHWKGGTLGGVNIVAVGCVAFAFRLSDEAFGSLPNRMYAAGGFSFEDIKVGDILRVNNDTHTVIVLEVSDAGVVIAEGNYSGKVHWGRALSKEDVMSSTSHYITRYPEGYVSPDDPTANDIIGNGTLEGGLIWELTKAGTLTISGSGAMPDFSSAGDQPWSENSSRIRKVVIGDGVTGIGSCAFWDCGVLSAEISSSVTTIGSSAFRGSSIISVTIPSGVKTIGDSAFRDCENLSSVTVSEGVETIVQNAFRACTSLTSIALPASIGEVGAAAFFGCTAMTSATFAPGSKQVKMGDNMFTQCYYLMEVTLPSNIDCIGEGMFQNCQMLPGVIIPQGAESIGGSAFASSGVSVVVIPDSVTTIGIAAFSACPLTDIYFTGTEEQWNSISKIGDTATTVSKATIHYNYKPDPSPAPDPNPDDDDNSDDDDNNGDNSNAGDNGDMIETSPTEYVVTFVAGSDTYSEKYEVGSLISKIPDGVYKLVGDAPIEGLYTDKLFTAKSKWNQSTSVVLENTTLYVRYAAQISEDEDGKPAGVLVQAIPDQVYTGADIKPDVVVYAVDGTLLKKGRDYTITYTKNAATKANIDENGNPIPGVDQPYLTIKGKGNYDTESVVVKFNIVPASIGSGDTFAAGFTAKINESVVLGSKPVAAVSSLKYKKAMAIGTDYTVSITYNGEDKTKGVTTDTKGLPAVNEEGNYTVTIMGKGNYCGTVTKIISTSDKDHLLNNATVKLGSNIKKIDFASIGTGDGKIDMSKIASDAATPDTDKFSVTAKTKETLTTDMYTYKVVYANGSTTTPAVGKAQLIVTAKDGSGYFGSKSISFTVVGTAAKNGVTIGDSNGRLADVTYNGKAHTEYNNVEVRTISDKTLLVHKKDYTITYKNNIKKGTATMIVTMLPESGYTGSIKATFKITAAVMTTDLIKNVSDFTISNDAAAILNKAVSYSKAGVKPSDKISMSLDNGYVLQEGIDYTVSYKNNTTISGGTKVPAMTIKGKGNFTGSYTVTFDIVPASLEELYKAGDLVVTVTSQAYKSSAETYAVKVKVTDAGKALSVKKDYVLSGPVDAAAVDAYLHTDGERPEVTISGSQGTGGCYTGEISVPLSFYDPDNKLTSKNVAIEFKDANGNEVDAYYRNGAQVTMDDYLLVYFTDANGNKKLLSADSYTVTWGKNNTAGDRKGTVTITGQGKYGGSAKCTFNIRRLGLTTSVMELVTYVMNLQKTAMQTH
ncbi:MAG: leucine-rich repeat domain-containing protein [Lachnospiraceae bacterium]|nr:leucine-rich repeat domain-containing protein [Lachnospiraceae bacterium]